MAKSTLKRKRASSSATESPRTVAVPTIDAPETVSSEAGRASESYALASQAVSASEMLDELSADEKALWKRQQKWTSDVYKHYKPAVIKRNADGEKVYAKGVLVYEFVCKRTGEKKSRKSTDVSTGNLKKHADACMALGTSAKFMEKFVAGCTYSRDGFRWKLVNWIINKNRPYAIVEDPELIDIFCMLHGRLEVPCASTLSKDIKIVHGIAKRKLIQLFEEFHGAIHIALDGWTSKNASSYLGLITQWCPSNSDQIMKLTLDLVRVPKSNTGMHLAENVHCVLEEFHLSQKLLGLAGDNASNNDTMIDELGVLLPTWGGQRKRVRCFGLILNLIEQAFLWPFRPKKIKNADNQKSETDYEFEGIDNDSAACVISKLCALYEPDDPEDEEAHEDVGDSREEELAAEMDVLHALTVAELGPMTPREQQDAMFMLMKAIGLAKRIAHSDQLRTAFAESCEHVKIKHLGLKRPVATRWNTQIECLERELTQKEAVIRLCENPIYARFDLEKYSLSPREWETLEHLKSPLATFERITKHMLRSNVVLVHQVIPMIDHLNTELESIVNDEQKPKAVRHGAKNALRVLDNYYASISESEIYRVAMILHPRYKMAYFQAKGWPQEWIETAVDIARRVWHEKYKIKDLDMPVSGIKSSVDEFDDFDSVGLADEDAFEHYLGQPPEHYCIMPLAFWHAKQASGCIPQALARFAKDYLSCPATSIDVGRLFSRSGKTDTPPWNHLSDDSVRATVVLNSWNSIPELSAEMEYKDMLVKGWKRGTNKE